MFEFFNIQFGKLAEWLIPIKMRYGVLMAWVKSLFGAVIILHNDFMRYRKAKLYQIQMNYQVVYLESFLNQRFDTTLRRIYITDAENQVVKYIFTRVEGNPLLIFRRSENQPQIIYSRGESNGDYVNDFIIWVPYDVVFDEREHRAMVSTKLSGKRYKIELF